MTTGRPIVDDGWLRASQAFPELAGGGVVVEPRERISREVSMVDGDWRTRLAPSPVGLTGPIGLRGNCLSPVLNDGTSTWFDVAAEPADGDFVLLNVDAELVAQLLEAAGGDAPPGRYETLLVKQWQTVDGHPLLCAREGVLNVYATVRAVLRYYQQPLPLPRKVKLAELQALLRQTTGDVPMRD